MNTIIKRGDVYFADLHEPFGSEQGGRRPVLVIQNDVGNKHSPTIIVAPLTSQAKKFLPTHVPVTVEDGLKVDSTILLEQVRVLDKGRLKSGRITSLGCSIMSRVDNALAISFGMTPSMAS
jgi:mRNA interferase MazF